jgi:hypothetical protein
MSAGFVDNLVEPRKETLMTMKPETYIPIIIGGLGVAAWLYAMSAIAAAVSGDIYHSLQAIGDVL